MDGKKEKMKSETDYNISSDFQTPLKKLRKAQKVAKTVEIVTISSQASDPVNSESLESKSNRLDDVSERPDEDYDTKKKCPTCSKSIPIATFSSHSIYCLKQFERQQAKPGCSRRNVDLELVCLVCNKDLSHMNATRRAQHMNKCLDKLEETDSDSLAESNTVTVLNCPVCSFCPSSQKARLSHLKQCAKKHGISTKKIIEFVQLQERQAQERKAMGLSEMPPPPKRVVQKTRSRATRQRRHESAEEDHAGSEEMQMAMAMSLSTSQERVQEDDNRVGELLLALGHTTKPSEIPSKKRRKKNEKSETPILLLRSEEDRSAIVSCRVEEILAEKPYGSLVNWEKVPPHRSILKRTEECHLWKLASLSKELTKDPLVFYVKDLEPFVSPCKLKPGSKQKRLSMVPGYGSLTQPVNEVDEDGVEAANESGDEIPCTLDVLCNLARDFTPSSQIASQGFFTSETDEVDERNPEENGFLKMVANILFSDCTIELDDGVLIPCHRFPLYANCSKACDEIDENGILRWAGITKPTVIAFLQFIYSGTVVEKNYSKHQLKSISERYDLGRNIAEVCGFHLEEQPNVTVDRDEVPREMVSKECDEGQVAVEDVVTDDDIVELSGTVVTNNVHSQIPRKKVELEMVTSQSRRNRSNSSVQDKGTSPSRERNVSSCKRSLQFVAEPSNDAIVEQPECPDGISVSVFENDCVQNADIDKNAQSPNLFDEPFEDDELFENLNLVGISQEKNPTVTSALDNSQEDHHELQRELRNTPSQQITSVPNSPSKSISTSTPKNVSSSRVDGHHGIQLSISPVGQRRSNFVNTPETVESTSGIPIASTPQYKKPVPFLWPRLALIDTCDSIVKKSGKNVIDCDDRNKNLPIARVSDPPSHVLDVVSESSSSDVGDENSYRGDFGCHEKQTEMLACRNLEKTFSDFEKKDLLLSVDDHLKSDGNKNTKKRTIMQVYENLDVSSSSSDVHLPSSSKRKRSSKKGGKSTDKLNSFLEGNESPRQNQQKLAQDHDKELPASCGFEVGSRDTSVIGVWNDFNDDGYYDSPQGMPLEDPLPGPSISTLREKRKSVTFNDVLELVSPSNSSWSLTSENAIPDIPSLSCTEAPLPQPADESELSLILETKRKTKEKAKKKTKDKKKKGKAKLSVTPLPHYSVMPTPEVKKALSKIGVKAMPKKKASKLLKHVYYETHPVVSCDESGNASEVELPDLLPSVNSKEKDKKKRESLERSLNRENIKQFIKSHVQWHKAILQYKAIDINALMVDMRSTNLQITEKKLKKYLDEECITYTEPGDDSPRKKRSSPRKKKSRKSPQ